MAEKTARKGGKKHRKHGRKSRSPSCARRAKTGRRVHHRTKPDEKVMHTDRTWWLARNGGRNILRALIDYNRADRLTSADLKASAKDYRVTRSGRAAQFRLDRPHYHRYSVALGAINGKFAL